MSRRSPIPRAARRFATAAAIVLLVACGSGSGDSSSVLPCTNLSFTRALSSPGNGDVYFSPATATCTSLDVAVVVANLSGIYTVGFDFTFPSSLLAYQSYSLGPLLKQGNPPIAPVVVVRSSGAGEVQATMSLLAPDAAASATGSVVLIVFHFTKVASGSGSVDFDTSGTSQVSEEVLDQNGQPLAASFGPGHGGTALVP